MEQTETVPPPSRNAAKPTGKREQTKQQNRQIILDAARIVFAEHGYGATTVRDIIRATPLASGTFYNYFQSKEEVYQAMQDETALVIRPKLREAREKAGTVEEFISATFQTFFEFVLRDGVDVRAMRHNADYMRMRMDTPDVVAGFVELSEDIE
jgi:AcrR family transcriptional regulator